MTRHQIAQIAKNRNPKPLPNPAFSCGIRLLQERRSAALLNALWFFTGDYVVRLLVVDRRLEQ